MSKFLTVIVASSALNFFLVCDSGLPNVEADDVTRSFDDRSSASPQSRSTKTMKLLRDLPPIADADWPSYNHSGARELAARTAEDPLGVLYRRRSGWFGHRARRHRLLYTDCRRTVSRPRCCVGEGAQGVSHWHRLERAVDLARPHLRRHWQHPVLEERVDRYTLLLRPSGR